MAKDRLTDRACRAAKSGERIKILPDGAGLRLVVHPNGSKYWQLRYTIAGKESTASLGNYPETGLEQARTKRDDLRSLVKAGVSPAVKRRADRLSTIVSRENTLSAVASAWITHGRTHPSPRTGRPWSDNHLERNEGLFRRILEPRLGKLPIRDIDERLLRAEIEQHYKAGTRESARRAAAIAVQIFTFAKENGLYEGANPAAELLKYTTLAKPKVRNFSALPRDQVGPMLRALESSNVDASTSAALILMLFTGLRDNSLRAAEWTEIDLKAGTWVVPAERMKSRREHVVPLTRQAVALLEKLAERNTGRYVFASKSEKGHLAENTLRVTLHRLGFKVTAHGMRSLITDVLNDASFNPDAIEAQLDHVERNAVRRAYLRTKFWEQRVAMMQWFADWCDAQKDGTEIGNASNVSPLRVA